MDFIKIREYWDTVYNWGKDKILVILVVLIMLVLFLLFKTNSSIIFIKPQIGQKVRLEVYDTCLDSNISVEDSLEIMDFLADTEYKPKIRKYVAVHIMGSVFKPTAKPLTKKEVQDFFWYEKYPGTQMVGYNYIIDYNSVLVLNPINRNNLIEKNEVCWGVANFNSTTTHIAIRGGLVKKNGKWVAADTRTPRQTQILDSLIRDIMSFSPNVKVQGHRDFPNVRKTCPNFLVTGY